LTQKLAVGLIFGGRSGEHEVSLQSAKSILNALDPEKYSVTQIGIDRDGSWLLSGNPLKILSDRVNNQGQVRERPDQARPGLVRTPDPSHQDLLPNVDIVFPILHGPYGEDGKIQGLLEMAGRPYVGAGVLGSAVGMDKAAMKALLEHAGLPVAPHVLILRSNWRSDSKSLATSLVDNLGYPMFVKPANLGSSVGISKVHNLVQLHEAMDLAAKYDRRLIVEQAIDDAHEIECSVLGNDSPEASVCGEVFPAGEFYDYESKYMDDRSRTVIPAHLSSDLVDRVRTMAVKVFTTLDICGMARVDFLVRRADDEIFVLEANTIPGFTDISMYAKLWEASGLPYNRLLDRLIELGFERFREQSEMRSER